jgi:pimeloyl-ACP methyl ester carboxylesterase
MPFAAVNGIELYYEVHGPESAPALVFAHGAGGNHLSWWQQVPHFARRFRCITFDHRGFGQSHDLPNGPGGAAFADDLRALLDHLGIAKASFVAQSMGGWTVLRFALRHPERVERFVMADTHGGLTTPEIAEAMRDALSGRSGMPPGVHPAAGARMAEEQPALQFLYGQVDGLNPPREPRQLGVLLAAAGAPTPGEVASLDMLVLFIAGEEDVVIPPAIIDRAAACFRNARIERVARAGHSVYFERPAEFNRLVERFLG